MTEQTLHSGGTLVGRVTVTGDIVSVTMEGFGLRMALYPYGPARFAAMGSIPEAPAMFLNRAYTINAVGVTADGHRVTSPITLRLVR